MSHRYGIISILIIVAAILADCSPQTGITSHPSPEITISVSETAQEPDLSAFEAFIKNLNESDMSIKIGGYIEAPYFSTQGRVIRANGEEIQIYQYYNVQSRKADSDNISGDGTIKGQANISWISQPFIWAYDRLLVIYIGSNSRLVELINRSLGEPISQPDSTQPRYDPTFEYPIAVLETIRDLSRRLDVHPDQITVIEYESKVWTDSCLGVIKAGEMCLQILTPGFIISLGVGDERFEYHSDEIGQRLKLAGETIPEGS